MRAFVGFDVALNDSRYPHWELLLRVDGDGVVLERGVAKSRPFSVCVFPLFVCLLELLLSHARTRAFA